MKNLKAADTPCVCHAMTPSGHCNFCGGTCSNGKTCGESKTDMSRCECR